MNKKKLFVKNLQDIIDAENQFYNWFLSIEFKPSREEYKFNSSEMRFLLEINDVSNYLRFYVSIKQNDKSIYKIAQRIIDNYINILTDEEFRKKTGINTNERIQAWINYIATKEYLIKLKQMKNIINFFIEKNKRK